MARDQTWTRIVGEGIRYNEMRRRRETVEAATGSDRIDWLKVALHRVGAPHPDTDPYIGSVDIAAQRLGVTRQNIHKWLKNGLGRTKFANIVKLVEESNIEYERLVEYIGLTKNKRAHARRGSSTTPSQLSARQPR